MTSPSSIYWNLWDLKPGRRMLIGDKFAQNDKPLAGELVAIENGCMLIKVDGKDETKSFPSGIYVFQPVDKPEPIRIKFGDDKSGYWFVFQMTESEFMIGGVDLDKLEEFEEHHGKTQYWNPS